MARSARTGSVAAPEPTQRLSRDGRYEALLDDAAALLDQGGLDAVTMDAVAARAGVSRPLVYKHFPNRRALLTALWRREAAAIDARSAAAVRDAPDFEAIVRYSVEARFDALERPGLMLAPLLHSELFDPDLRKEQGIRRARIRSWYTAQHMKEFGLSKSEAEAAATVYFAGLDSIVAEYRTNPQKRTRRELVETFVCLVMGGLRAMQARSAGTTGDAR